MSEANDKEEQRNKVAFRIAKPILRNMISRSQALMYCKEAFDEGWKAKEKASKEELRTNKLNLDLLRSENAGLIKELAQLSEVSG